MFLFFLYLLCYFVFVFFFLMIRRPPRSTQSRSSAASDVYKRQVEAWVTWTLPANDFQYPWPVSYTHLRAHETRHDLVCRLLLEKKKKKNEKSENIKNHIKNNKKKQETTI